MRRPVLEDGHSFIVPRNMAEKRLVDMDRQKGTLSPSFAPTRPPSLLLRRDVRGVIIQIEGGI